jgi:hypothetical protein
MSEERRHMQTETRVAQKQAANKARRGKLLAIRKKSECDKAMACTAMVGASRVNRADRAQRK